MGTISMLIVTLRSLESMGLTPYNAPLCPWYKRAQPICTVDTEILIYLWSAGG